MTVREETYEVLRKLGLTTFFGNPGSTEVTFLRDFPDDFRYVLALQEASVVAIADGYAQGTGEPAFVNLHTAAGVATAMGSLATAYHNKTPLIVTAGQQTREMLLLEPWITNLKATTLPEPYVKWSHEPSRAEDVPAALMRAYAEAVQPPQGPVFVSIPMDDWEKESLGPTAVRGVSTRTAPDPARLDEVADALRGAGNPALVVGPGVDRGGGWDAGVRLAEILWAAVYAPPAPERTAFPEDHPLYRGELPFAIKQLSEKLRGHDVVAVLGAPVFRYYPYVPGDYLPEGTRLWHMTDDPGEAARAPVGEAVLGDPVLALEALGSLFAGFSTDRQIGAAPEGAGPPPEPSLPLTPGDLFAVLDRGRPDGAVMVQESPSNWAALHERWKVTQPASYFTFASAILGFGLPAAVGLALAERDAGRDRPVLAVVGDGSFHYSPQALWTAVRLRLPLLVVVVRNDQYAILRALTEQQDTPGVPGLDLPGLDIAGTARSYGCHAQKAEKAEGVAAAMRGAWERDAPTVLEVPISKQVPSLL